MIFPLFFVYIAQKIAKTGYLFVAYNGDIADCAIIALHLVIVAKSNRVKALFSFYTDGVFICDIFSISYLLLEIHQNLLKFG